MTYIGMTLGGLWVLGTFYVAFLLLGRWIEGVWLWDWPLELFRDAFGRSHR